MSDQPGVKPDEARGSLSNADAPARSGLSVGLLVDSGALFTPVVLESLVVGELVSIETVFWRDAPRSVTADIRRVSNVARRSGLRYAIARANATARTEVPAVEDAIAAHNCEVMRIESARSPSFRRMVRSRDLDLIVTILYPEILPPAIFETPRFGGLNLHPSRLPRYAGTNPLYWALAHGESQVGVTIHRLTEKVDGGDIVAQEIVEVAEADTLTTLYARVAVVGGRLLASTLDTIAAEQAVIGRPQEGQDYFRRPTARSYRRFRALGRQL